MPPGLFHKRLTHCRQHVKKFINRTFYPTKSGGSWISREMIPTPEILYFSQPLLWLGLLGFHHNDSFDILHTLPSSLESLGCTSPA